MEPYSRNETKRFAASVTTKSLKRSDETYVTQVTPYSSNWTNSYGGFKNPYWKRQVARGIQAGTSLTIDAKSVDSAVPGYAKGVDRTSTQSATYIEMEQSGLPFIWAIPSALTSVHDDKADAVAKSAFYKRWDQERRLFDGATFLAELGDTLRMVRNPLSAFRKGVDAWNTRAERLVRRERRDLYRRLKGRKPGSQGSVMPSFNKRVREALAGSYLEWAFGIAPLVNDVESGLNALEEFPFPRHRVRISATGDYETESFTTGTKNESWFAWTYARQTVNKWSVRYIGGLNPSVVNQPRRAFRDAASLRLTDFVPALWEWMPYSFLIDYFTNTGEIIRAYSNPIVGLDWTLKTIRRHSQVRSTAIRCTIIPGSTGLYKVTKFSPPQVVCSSRVIQRNAMASPPLPQFGLKVPGATSLRWLNIGALAAMKTRNLNLYKSG